MQNPCAEPIQNPCGIHAEPMRNPCGAHVEPMRNPHCGTHSEPIRNPCGARCGTHAEPPMRNPCETTCGSRVRSPLLGPVSDRHLQRVTGASRALSVFRIFASRTRGAKPNFLGVLLPPSATASPRVVAISGGVGAHGCNDSPGRRVRCAARGDDGCGGGGGGADDQKIQSRKQTTGGPGDRAPS